MSQRCFSTSAGSLPRVKILRGKKIKRCCDCDGCVAHPRKRKLVSYCQRFKQVIRWAASGPIESWCRLRSYRRQR